MPKKTLFVDDDASLLEQAEIFLDRVDPEIEVHTAVSVDEALQMMDQDDYDVIISDYQMPNRDGLDFLKEIREVKKSDIPFIMFTGKGSEEVAVKAFDLGVDRYIQKAGEPKSQYMVLAEAVDQAIELRKTEKALERSKKRYRTITEDVLEQADFGIIILDQELDIVWINESVEEYFGLEKEEVIGKDKEALIDDRISPIFEEPERFKSKVLATYENNTYVEYLECHVLPDEEKGLKERWLRHWSKPIDRGLYKGGRIEHYTDVTERKKLEEALRESRKKYKRMFEETPLGAFHYDENGVITDCNDRFVEMMGASREELIGFNTLEQIENEEVIEEIRSSLEHGEGYYEGEYTSITGDVTKIGRSFFRGISDDKGDINTGIALIEDITKRKEAERKIEEHQRKLERLHEISAKLQTYDSESDVYSLAIEASEDILDFYVCEISVPDEDHMRGIASSSNFPEKASLESNPIPINDSIAGKTFLEKSSYLVNNADMDVDAKPTDKRFKSVLSIPIGDRAVFQALSTKKDHFDENDLKIAELLISHVSQALDRIQAKKREDFLHSLLRHDVRNKNQIIKGYLKIIKDHEISEEVEELVQKAEHAARDSIDRIEKVRKLRRISEEDETTEMYLHSVMEHVLSENEDQLKEKDVDIDIKGCEFKVKGGPLLKELFFNLIENSIQHGECDKIRIRSKALEDECLICVEDDGVGISDKFKDKIFDKGFKFGKRAGSGLGLHMVKQIAETYDGSVEVKDSDMGGARFDVYLKKVDDIQ